RSDDRPRKRRARKRQLRSTPPPARRMAPCALCAGRHIAPLAPLALVFPRPDACCCAAGFCWEPASSPLPGRSGQEKASHGGRRRRSRPRQAFNTVRRAALARTQAKEDSQEAPKNLEVKEEEPDGSVQQRKQSRALACSGRSLAEWRPLEAFYEPTQDTIFYSFLSVAAATVLAGGGLLIAQGLNAEYFILVFVLVVIAFGFLVALLGLKAVSPQESAPDGS
ncbi:unnamed protein product, partial [Effrenium voratum]